MDEFVQELDDLRSRSAGIGRSLAAKHRLAVSEPPLAVFEMIFNHATIAREHTSHYDEAWKRAGRLFGALMSENDIKRTRKDNSERLVSLSKYMFMGAMSAIEFNAKQSIVKYPKALQIKQKNKKDLYFREIIKASTSSGLISTEQEVLWLGANTIRNRLVHNNGYGDRNCSWQFSSGLTVHMKDGQMLRGSIMTAVRLTKWVTDAQVDWTERFLAKAL